MRACVCACVWASVGCMPTFPWWMKACPSRFKISYCTFWEIQCWHSRCTPRAHYHLQPMGVWGVVRRSNRKSRTAFSSLSHYKKCYIFNFGQYLRLQYPLNIVYSSCTFAFWKKHGKIINPAKSGQITWIVVIIHVQAVFSFSPSFLLFLFPSPPAPSPSSPIHHPLYLFLLYPFLLRSTTTNRSTTLWNWNAQ